MLIKDFNKLALIFIFIHTHALSAKPNYKLNDLLNLAEKNSLISSIIQTQHQEIELTAKNIDTAYAWTLKSNISTTDDQSPTQNQSMGDQRKIHQLEFSFEKLFSTGTIIAASIKGQKSDIIFEEQEQAAPTAPGANLFKPSINPEETSKLELTISQPLWKNFNGKEIQLKKEQVLSNKHKLGFEDQIQIQNLKGQVEELYWKIIAIELKIQSMKKLVSKSKQFIELTKKRVRIGRADQIDTASAEANLVSNEGILLKLKIALDSYYSLLSHVVFPGQSTKKIRLYTQNLENASIPLSITTQQQAIDKALKHRQDIMQLETQKLPYYKEYQVAKEQDRLSLNAFANFSGNGLDKKRGEAFKQASGGENPTLTIGLKLEKKLGGLNSRIQLEKYQNISNRVSLQKKNMEYQIKRKIALAWLEKESSNSLMNQAKHHLRSLEKQRSIEQQKFQQARAEEISIVRYDLEIISAETEYIEAREKQRLAEAKIRLLTHGY